MAHTRILIRDGLERRQRLRANHAYVKSNKAAIREQLSQDMAVYFAAGGTIQCEKGGRK